MSLSDILEAFAPELVLVSAGFDAHERDPLSSMRLSAEAYARMTAGLREQADRSAGGRLVSCLEGGYDLIGLSISTSLRSKAQTCLLNS